MRLSLIATAALLAAAAPLNAQVTILDTGGFEGYTTGSIIGQHGWIQGNAFGLPNQTATVTSAPGGGQAVLFDDTQDAGSPRTETAIENDFANLTGTYHYALTTFDMYRDGNGLYNNMFWWPAGNNPWAGAQYDNSANPVPGAQIAPFGIGSPSVLMPQSQWFHMTLQFDLNAGTEDAYVNGTPVALGFNIGTGDFNGWFFDDTNTLDTGRTPNGRGQRAYIDNLKILAGNSPFSVPEPSSIGLLAAGILPLLGFRRKR